MHGGYMYGSLNYTMNQSYTDDCGSSNVVIGPFMGSDVITADRLGTTRLLLKRDVSYDVQYSATHDLQ